MRAQTCAGWRTESLRGPNPEPQPEKQLEINRVSRSEESAERKPCIFPETRRTVSSHREEPKAGGEGAGGVQVGRNRKWGGLSECT